MSNSQKLILSILTGIGCILSLVIINSASNIYKLWLQQPLGPALKSSTPIKLAGTWTATHTTQQANITLAPTTIKIGAETPSSPFLPCNNLPTMSILAIGVDSRSDDYRYGRADVIRAVRVDYRVQRITVLAFPRDLWVRIPEVRDALGVDRQKLNSAYTYGNPGLQFWDHPSQGPGLLARTLELNFGLKADRYIAVSMNVFVEVVDELGGLDINLPDGVDGRTSSDRSKRLIFPPGEQHLSGEQALTLARLRNVSIFKRASHQNQVMCSLREQIDKPETIAHIPAILSSIKRNILTDLTPEQISQMACLGTQTPRSNIIFATFPRALFKPDTVYDPVAKQDLFVWDTDFNQMRDYVTKFQAGTWPISSPFATPENGTSTCEV